MTSTLRPAPSPGGLGSLSAFNLAVVLAVLVTFGATGFLLWNQQLAAAVGVQIGAAIALCGLGSFERSRPICPLLTPLVAVATAQGVVLALPMPRLDPPIRLALLGMALWLTVLVAQRAASPHRRSARLLGSAIRQAAASLRHYAPDWRLGALLMAGAGVGAVAGATLPGYPQTRSQGPGGLALEALMLVGALAVPEELLFRGLLTPAVRRILGRPGVAGEGLLYASVYAASQRWSLLAVVFVAGVGASVVRCRTGWVRGLCAAHGVAMVFAVIVMPQL